jgi:DNA-binding transcriptional MerR regulator
MPDGLRIGELAVRTGRSVHSLRWYEAQGLMPGVVRDGGGRRVYSDQHVEWLALMERLRLTGMSIAQMRHYTTLVKQGKTTLGARRELLRAHRQRVEQTIAEWKAALQLLDRKIDFYGEWLATGRAPKKLPTAARGAGRRRQP